MYATFSFFLSIVFLLHQDVWAKGADSDSETAVVDTKVRGDGTGRWLGEGLPETREADFSWALAFVAPPTTRRTMVATALVGARKAYTSRHFFASSAQQVVSLFASFPKARPALPRSALFPFLPKTNHKEIVPACVHPKPKNSFVDISRLKVLVSDQRRDHAACILRPKLRDMGCVLNFASSPIPCMPGTYFLCICMVETMLGRDDSRSWRTRGRQFVKFISSSGDGLLDRCWAPSLPDASTPVRSANQIPRTGPTIGSRRDGARLISHIMICRPSIRWNTCLRGPLVPSRFGSPPYRALRTFGS